MSTPMTKTEVNSLFNDFLNHPKLVWGANNTGCEARADLMAEIASEKGYEVSKIWIRPLDSNDSFLVYLNEAGTEMTAWNYHVAILVKMKNGSSSDTMVIDPSLFDEAVSIDTWNKRLTRLSDQYDVNLEIKESKKEAFFGPEDMLTSSNRQNALAKREEILANSSNMDDPTIFDGFMMKLRGEFVDELKAADPQKFEKLKVMLRDEEFSKWFKRPIPNNQLRNQLTSSKYYGINSSLIKNNVDVSQFEASVRLKEHYWEQIGTAFEKLTAKSQEILNGGFNQRTQLFRIEWEEDFFRSSWYSPSNDEIWSKYGFSADDLQN